jgi:hypothetical protein
VLAHVDVGVGADVDVAVADARTMRSVSARAKPPDRPLWRPGDHWLDETHIPRFVAYFEKRVSENRVSDRKQTRTRMRHTESKRAQNLIRHIVRGRLNVVPLPFVTVQLTVLKTVED